MDTVKSGLPKVKVCDMTVQERENDLVVATFGRGFYILDDYSPLRTASKELFEKDAYLFPVKDALMYIPKSGRGGAQGTSYFTAPNPEYGATFTYYIKDVPKTAKAERHEKEKALFKDGKPIPQPTLDAMHAEDEELEPYLIFTVTDEAGNVVRKINNKAGTGINRVNWDLRGEGTSPVTSEKFEPIQKPTGRRFRGGGSGFLVMPGKYKVSIALVSKFDEKELVGPTEFNVVALNNTTLPAADRSELVAFQNKAAELARSAWGAQRLADELSNKVESLKQAINNTPAAPFSLLKKANDIADELDNINLQFRGLRGNAASNEEIPPAPVTLNSRISTMVYTSMRTTTNITQNEKTAYSVLHDKIIPVINDLKRIETVEIKAVEDELEKLGGPWTPGRMPEVK